MSTSLSQDSARKPTKDAGTLPLIAGELSLELCNTVTRRHTDTPREHLPDYPALVSWALRAGALDASTAAELSRIAAGRPGESARALALAHELRSVIHAAFLAVVRHGTPDTEAIAELDRHVRGAFRARRLIATANGARLSWGREGSLARPLWPLALSAATLLSTPELGLVRECAAHPQGCGWLFLDTSRTGTRRWCSMELCGNRAKARRHYRRAQSE
jgi:predicted RNA-binding Zn ribbon-like protein